MNFLLRRLGVAVACAAGACVFAPEARSQTWVVEIGACCTHVGSCSAMTVKFRAMNELWLGP